VVELEAAAVLRRGRRRHGAVSRFPSVRRDLALVVPRQVAAGTVLGVLERVLEGVLVDLRLFDVYEGKGIDSTEKSLGVGLTSMKAKVLILLKKAWG
jgi:phenylalanyl-tRNA synthetase beta chain